MPTREYAVDGDEGFIGLNSRDNPVNLGKNFVSKAQNIRMDRGIATVRKGAERLTTGALVGETIYGACAYTTASGSELIAIATADGLYTFNPDTETTSSKILFPGAVLAPTVSATFNSADGITVVVTSTAHTVLAGVPIRITASASGYSGDYVVTSVTVNTFTYVMPVAAAPNSGSCTYEKPVINTIDGITAVVTSNSHGLIVGTRVNINSTNSSFSGVFTITAATTNTFSYTLTEHTQANTYAFASYNGTNIIAPEDEVELYQATGIGYVYILRGFDKSVLRWDGASVIATPVTGTHHNYPPSRHAIYYGNRHIVQTDRNTISVSHYLQDNHWSALDVFTINDGSNDSIVAITPWTLNEFVIFMRGSIFYAAAGVGANAIGDPAQEGDSYIKSLATDIGCIAKGSIVQAGGGIIFLSDNGVYMLNPAGAGNGSANTPEGMRLLTLAEPLSAPINDIISRINYNAVGAAVATYWENRYYLAVPLDDSIRNNVTLVYNFINKAWESVDTYPENSNVTTPVAATFSTASYVSGGFINVQINKDGHGLAVGDKANISFVDDFGGSTDVTTKYPNGTYVVQSSPYDWAYFYIKIPYTANLAMPLGFYYGGNCLIAKANSFSFKKFIVAKRGNRRRMFMVNETEGVFLLEELDYDEFGNASGTPMLPFYIPAEINPLSFEPIQIEAEMITRAYSFQTTREKRFSSIQVDASFEIGSAMDTSFITVNPDHTTLVSQFGSETTEDVILRVPTRKSGYYSQVKFNTKNLRPSVRSVTVEAIIPGHMTQSKK